MHLSNIEFVTNREHTHGYRRRVEAGQFQSAVYTAALLIAGVLMALVISKRAFASQTDTLSVMPMPQSVERGAGKLQIQAGFSAAYAGFHDARLESGVARTLTRLERKCGARMPHAAAVGPTDASSTSRIDASNASFIIEVARAGDVVQSIDEDESYHLTVNSTQARLTATTVVGALRGMETLLQLARFESDSCVLPEVTIEDAPRFRWRGLMLDVSRHFEPVSVVKRTLDGMALVKLNVFHWHLSDDQGFRAESKRFPKLTGMGSSGNFYTQEQMREVVAYARDRGIRVVPEFDMPGHTVSWQLGHPEIGSGTGPYHLPIVFGVHDEALDPTREETYKFLDAFIGEMAAIFPDAYFHIGGDETNGVQWLANPKIKAFMQAKGFKDPAGLQAYFNQRLLPIVTRHGKRMIGWDEILNPALPKDVMIQSWRGDASLAEGARQGYSGILSAPYYLDGMRASETIYLADPVPADTTLTPAQQKLILGGEICMWAEQLFEDTVDSRLWPRSAAIAERFWSPAGVRDVGDMYRRLRVTSLLLEDVGLTHISGPQRVRRSIAFEPDPAALEVFASVIEPVSFGERYDTQKTNALTPLDRLVDGVVPDPASRQQIAAQVNELTSQNPSAAWFELQERFESWQEAAPALAALARKSPLLSDAGPRIDQLNRLAESGREALAYLRNAEVPPPAWKQEQLRIIDEAEKPSALVRFTFLPSLRKLVELAAPSIEKTAP